MYNMLITNSYSKLERIIAGFVSLIALAYLVEVNMVDINWLQRYWLGQSEHT